MVLKGILWYGIARHDLVLYGILQLLASYSYGMVSQDMIQCCMATYYMVLYGITWYGVPGMASLDGIVWYADGHWN